MKTLLFFSALLLCNTCIQNASAQSKKDSIYFEQFSKLKQDRKEARKKFKEAKKASDSVETLNNPAILSIVNAREQSAEFKKKQG